tara:strand:- start:1106 stop:1573 length:468 start_codon:yes stop_codon:yes gene_type:complete
MGKIKVKALERKDVLKATDYIYKAVNSAPTYREHSLNKIGMERTLSDCVYDPNKCCYLMLDNNKIVGMLGGYISSTWFSSDRILYDMGIFIDKEYRGGGKSKPLLMKWFKYADDMAVDEIIFSCTADPAYYKQLYEYFTKKLEFTLMGVYLKKRR